MFQAFSSLVEEVLLKKSPGLKHELSVALNKHKPQLTALLKNPVSLIIRIRA